MVEWVVGWEFGLMGGWFDLVGWYIDFKEYNMVVFCLGLVKVVRN